MSWWISLEDKDGEYLRVEAFSEGGTRPIPPIDDATMNVTWNYGIHYGEVVNTEEGIRWLHGKKAKDTVECLTLACKRLSDETSEDYWKATEGNAKKPLLRFLEWAKQHPEGIWRVN